MALGAQDFAIVVLVFSFVHFVYSAIMLSYQKDFFTFGFTNVPFFLWVSIAVNVLLVILAIAYLATHSKEHFKEDEKKKHE